MDLSLFLFGFFIASLLFFSGCFSVTSSSFLRRFCFWDGTVDGVFPVAAKEGRDGDLVVKEVNGDRVEAAGDGRVILGSLAHQDGIAGATDARVIDGDDERDGATPKEVAPPSCLSAPLQTIDGSASCLGRHQNRNLPWLLE